MSSFRYMKHLFVFLVLVLFAGCTAAPVVQDYPERQIDRPYTLPKGMASWQTYFNNQIEEDQVLRQKEAYSFVNPLIWNQALSDSWQLTWMPFPFLLSHQISRDESGYWGVSFGSGLGITSSDGWYLTPFVNLTKRTLLGVDFALDTTLVTSFQTPFSSQYRDFTWEAGLVVSPLYQVTSHWVIGPTLSAFSRDEVILNFDFSKDDYIRRSHERRTRLPIGFQTKVLLSKQWEISADYLYHRIGYDEGYTLRETTLTATHYW